MGHYLYDDEGVKARRVTVVDKGILKTFLVDRAPVKGFARSNGHGRAEPGYVPVSRQSNLVVESSRSVSTEKLLDMLRDEARKQGKPFGLLFDNIEGGFTNTGRGSANAFNVLPNVVFKVYTDASRQPELVRGVDLIGTPLSAFGEDRRDRRQGGRLQRRLRRRERRRAGVRLVAAAARQRGRSAEEGAVAGTAADSRRAPARGEVLTMRTDVRRRAVLAALGAAAGARAARRARRSRRCSRAMRTR